MSASLPRQSAGLRRRVLAIIGEEAARAYLKPADIVGPVQTAPIARARHVAMRRARRETGLSYYVLGELFRRDHTCVLKACRASPLLERISPEGVKEIRERGEGSLK